MCSILQTRDINNWSLEEHYLSAWRVFHKFSAYRGERKQDLIKSDNLLYGLSTIYMRYLKSTSFSYTVLLSFLISSALDWSIDYPLLYYFFKLQVRVSTVTIVCLLVCLSTEKIVIYDRAEIEQNSENKRK